MIANRPRRLHTRIGESIPEKERDKLIIVGILKIEA